MGDFGRDGDDAFIVLVFDFQGIKLCGFSGLGLAKVKRLSVTIHALLALVDSDRFRYCIVIDTYLPFHRFHSNRRPSLISNKLPFSPTPILLRRLSYSHFIYRQVRLSNRSFHLKIGLIVDTPIIRRLTGRWTLYLKIDVTQFDDMAGKEMGRSS